MAATGKIVFIVGPTASGKSDLAMRLAQKYSGEILCADSQTVRRGLDIGTAKPSAEDQALVSHHLLNIIDPFSSFSVASFKELAENAIKDIQDRGKSVFVVGGTGLYIDSLFFNYTLEGRSEDKGRSELEMKSVKELHKIIVDNKLPMPENDRNPRHLIGVIMRQGQNPLDTIPRSNSTIYGILPADLVLKDRINERVDKMLEQGFIEEVKHIIEKYDRSLNTVDAIGYPITNRYLDGEISLDEAKELFKKSHWQYARRQKSWFRRNKFIQWFDDVEQAYEAITKDLNNN